jgi:hypothetical protein
MTDEHKKERMTPEGQAAYYEEREGEAGPFKMGDRVRLVAETFGDACGRFGRVIEVSRGDTPLRIRDDRGYKWWGSPDRGHRWGVELAEAESPLEATRRAFEEGLSEGSDKRSASHGPADCPGCTKDGERLGPHGAYLACKGRHGGVPLTDGGAGEAWSEDRLATARAMENLLREKAEQGLGPYPDDALLSDAMSVLRKGPAS